MKMRDLPHCVRHVPLRSPRGPLQRCGLSRSYAARRPLFRFRPIPSESELSSGPPENEISIAFAMLTP